MVDLGHLGMRCEEFHHLEGVGHMPLHTQREGFHPLEQQEGTQSRQAGAGVAKQHGTHTCGKRCRRVYFGKYAAVIVGVRARDCRVFVRKIGPGE